MSRLIYACRPLAAILMMVGLALIGAGVGATGANASPVTVPTAPARAAGTQWGTVPGHGPASGGSTITISPAVMGTPGHFIQVSVGGHYSAVIGSDGNLYTWGWNEDGRLGRDTGDADQDGNPGVVAMPAGVDKWTQINAGTRHSLAVGSDGNLYTWGRNSYGGLGRDTAIAPADRPGMVAKPAGVDKWTQARAGTDHSLAVGSDGNLYTWGWNDRGQIGRDTGSADHDQNPGMVAKPAGVTTWTQVRVGTYHSLAVGSDGNLYTWGCDYADELGRDTANGNHWDDTPGRASSLSFGKVVLTGVEFDGVAGTGLTANTDGTWSVTTPAHAAGVVTVTVSWTLNGSAQPDAHLTYTYEAAPVVTRTVTFDSAGGSAVTAQQVVDGQKAVRPADPTRDGYRFNGWFNGTDAYGFDRPVTGDLTLTAHWTRNTDPQPGDPTQKPAEPTGDPDSSDFLSSTGSDTTPILAAGLLTLAVGALTLVGVRTERGTAYRPSTRQD